MENETESTMYDFSAVVDVPAAETVRPGSSILITGPPMTGRDAVALDIIADGTRQGEGAVAMTTDGDASMLVEDLRDRNPDMEPHQLAVMDCRAEGNREESELDNGAFLHRVASPSDLTGIGIGITKSFERLHDAGLDRGRLGLTSLSTMITYSDTETVFKFCHVLSSRLDSAGFLGVFTIDSSAHDQQTLQVIKQAFDGVVELRESEGTREARLGGLRPEPSEWVEL